MGFDSPVAPDGHVIWRLDAVSRDGEQRLNLNAFLGGALSPHYFWKRRFGVVADPMDHSGFYLALHDRGRTRWIMNERRRQSIHRSSDHLAIGPSAFQRKGDGISIAVNEAGWPVGRAMRGRISIDPLIRLDHCVDLDRIRKHFWWPQIPLARVDVVFSQPSARWSGFGFFDAIESEQPLSKGMEGWDWSRSFGREGVFVSLEATARFDHAKLLAMRIDRGSRVHVIERLPRAWLPPSRWRLERGTRADDGKTASIVETLADTPFYSRSVISARLLGQTVISTHECLSLRRFHKDWVQSMLRLRIPRRR